MAEIECDLKAKALRSLGYHIFGKSQHDLLRNTLDPCYQPVDFTPRRLAKLAVPSLFRRSASLGQSPGLTVMPRL